MRQFAFLVPTVILGGALLYSCATSTAVRAGGAAAVTATDREELPRANELSCVSTICGRTICING